MPNATLTLDLKIDGQEMPNFPFIRRAVTTSFQVLDAFQKAADNNTTTYTAIPGIPADLQILILTADQALNVKMNASATPVPLNAGGVLMLFATDVTAGALTNVTLNNPGTVAANVSGGFGGS